MASSVYLLATIVLLAHLMRDLGAGRLRWPMAGLFALTPGVLTYATNGYMDILSGTVMTASLVLLVKIHKGEASPWMLGLVYGIAAFTKEDGNLWFIACGCALGLGYLLKRLPWQSLAAFGVFWAVIALPWLGVAKTLHQRNRGWNFSPEYMTDRAPIALPMTVRAYVQEGFGGGNTMRNMEGPVDLGPGQVFLHLRDSWLMIFYAAALAVLVGFRSWRAPPLRDILLVVVLQLAANMVLMIGTTLELHFHLVTSADRRLLQAAPGLVALAAAVCAAAFAPPPPAPLASGKKPGRK